MSLKSIFLKSVLLLSVSFASHAGTFVYVSNSDTGNVSHYSLDEKSGKLHFVNEVEAGLKGMPTAISPDKKYFYSAIRKQPYSIVSWKIEEKTGNLTEKTVNPINTAYAYITLDKTGKYLLGASYDKNVVESYSLDGLSLSKEPIDVYHTGPHAHSVVVDNTNSSIYVGNLGVDRVLQLKLSADGKMSNIGSGYVETAKDNGPRHSVISPDNRFVYNIGEMGGIVTQYLRHADGSLEKVSETESSVQKAYSLAHGKERPPEYNDPTRRVWASDLKLTANGKWLYVAERTSSTISGYKVDKKSGKLTLIGIWATEKQPRGIGIDPEGKFVIGTGEKSGYVTVYKIGHDGQLTKVDRVASGATDAVSDANWVSVVSYK